MWLLQEAGDREGVIKGRRDIGWCRQAAAAAAGCKEKQRCSRWPVRIMRRASWAVRSGKPCWSPVRLGQIWAGDWGILSRSKLATKQAGAGFLDMAISINGPAAPWAFSGRWRLANQEIADIFLWS